MSAGNRSSFMIRLTLTSLAVLALLCASVAVSSGHGVNVFVYVEGDSIIAEAYFSKSAKAKDCIVEVYDSQGKKLLQGKTDQQGIYAFKIADLPPVSGDLKFVLLAGQGHQGEFTLAAADLPKGARTDAASAPAAEKTVREVVPEKSDPSPQRGATAVDADQVARIVEEAVARQMQPVVKMLGNQQRLLLELQQRGPGVRDVVGGIGWIFGLVGVAAYLLSRRPREKPER
jgi:nickel transport protein